MVACNALETPDHARTVFTSPAPGILVTLLNGRVLPSGYEQIAPNQVRFDVPPDIGDVVTFFVH